MELALEDDLESGRHAEVIGRLGALVEEHPLRERLRGLLMLALTARAGRPSRWTPSGTPARRWWRRSGWSRDPSCAGSRRRSCVRIRRSSASFPTRPGLAVRPSQRSTRARGGRRGGATSCARSSRTRGERGRPPHPARRRARRAAARAGVSVQGAGVRSTSRTPSVLRPRAPRRRVVARLPGTSLLGVIGPSGNGKSSAVRAGLLPALAAGVLPGSERWTRVVLRPGEQPLATLARALAGGAPLPAALGALEPGSRLLVVVDQFEEVFTACTEPAQRPAFLEALGQCCGRDDGRLLAVLALRADFYGACASHPRFARLLGARTTCWSGRCGRTRSRARSRGPPPGRDWSSSRSWWRGWSRRPAGRTGGLPLLSTTLLELWQRRSEDRMTIRAYERTGGVNGAVARLAERVYERHPRGRRPPRATYSSGWPAPARRRRRSSGRCRSPSWTWAARESARRVLDVLTANRLVTASSTSGKATTATTSACWQPSRRREPARTNFPSLHSSSPRQLDRVQIPSSTTRCSCPPAPADHGLCRRRRALSGDHRDAEPAGPRNRAHRADPRADRLPAELRRRAPHRRGEDSRPSRPTRRGARPGSRTCASRRPAAHTTSPPRSRWKPPPMPHTAATVLNVLCPTLSANPSSLPHTTRCPARPRSPAAAGPPTPTSPSRGTTGSLVAKTDKSGRLNATMPIDERDCGPIPVTATEAPLATAGLTLNSGQLSSSGTVAPLPSTDRRRQRPPP